MPNHHKPGILHNLKINRVALVDAGANFDKSTKDGAHIMLFKSAPSLGDVHVDTINAPVEEKESDQNKEKPVKKTFIQKLLGLVTEPDVEKRKAAAIELEKEFPPEDDAPVHKAGDTMCKCADCVAMRKSATSAEITKAQADIAAVEKRATDFEKANVDLQKRLNEQIEKSEKAEMREVLKAFKATPFNLDTDVDVFRKMKSADSAGFDRAMAILKAADAQAAESAVYKNFGSGRDATGEGSAWAQIEAKADAIVEKTGDKYTREQAIEKVLMDPKNNKLVKQYRTEQQ